QLEVPVPLEGRRKRGAHVKRLLVELLGVGESLVLLREDREADAPARPVGGLVGERARDLEPARGKPEVPLRQQRLGKEERRTALRSVDRERLLELLPPVGVAAGSQVRLAEIGVPDREARARRDRLLEGRDRVGGSAVAQVDQRLAQEAQAER